MLEKTIEKHLILAVKQLGGKCLKWHSPHTVGMPDRLVLLPHGKMGFVEIKAKGKRLRQIQAQRKRELEQLGFSVACIDDCNQIGGVLRAIQAT